MGYDLTVCGIDELKNKNYAPLKGKRIGLVTHPAAISFGMIQTYDLLAKEPEVQLTALFGPEHGFTGEAQDLIPVYESATDQLRIYSLYGESFSSLKPTPAMLRGLDLLVIDLQDVGSRYYTFQTTMLYCLEACAQAMVPVMVLDRPNPLGRDVEGPTVSDGFFSFVGSHPICIRHGLTIGELAKLYVAEREIKVDLTVIKCRRSQPKLIPEIITWMPPSPNMPTTDTAVVYPGMCLIEGTNLSEGRGTTCPFQYVGHPEINPAQLLERLQAYYDLPVRWAIPVRFTPMFHKYAGKSCGGLFLPGSRGVQWVRAGLAIIMAFRDLLGDRFRWRTETYEFVSHIPAIDLLFGSDRERTMIEDGASYQDIIATWRAEESAFINRRQPFLIYP